MLFHAARTFELLRLIRLGAIDQGSGQPRRCLKPTGNIRPLSASDSATPSLMMSAEGWTVLLMPYKAAGTLGFNAAVEDLAAPRCTMNGMPSAESFAPTPASSRR